MGCFPKTSPRLLHAKNTHPCVSSLYPSISCPPYTYLSGKVCGISAGSLNPWEPRSFVRPKLMYSTPPCYVSFLVNAPNSFRTTRSPRAYVSQHSLSIHHPSYYNLHQDPITSSPCISPVQLYQERKIQVHESTSTVF